MKIATKIGLSFGLLVFALGSFVFTAFAFSKAVEPQTLKFEFTVEEVNVIFEGLGELPAKKSEGLRIKIYQTAQEQLKAAQSTPVTPQSPLPKKN
jgi:hypothetical protein